MKIEIPDLTGIQETKGINFFTILHSPKLQKFLAWRDAPPIQISYSGKVACPFHDDQTPSFAIYANGFYCFGCRAKGDPIEFIRRLTSCSFKEARELIDTIAADDATVRASWEASTIHARVESLYEEGPSNERYVWWCKVLMGNPFGTWDLIPDTVDARKWAISRGAGFFSVLWVDRPTVPCWYGGPWYIDLDGDKAAGDTARLARYLCKARQDFAIWDTGGRGYHVLVNTNAASPQLPLAYKEMSQQVKDELNLTSLDMNIYSMGKGRLWRIEGLTRPNGKMKRRIV